MVAGWGVENAHRKRLHGSGRGVSAGVTDGCKFPVLRGVRLVEWAGGLMSCVLLSRGSSLLLVCFMALPCGRGGCLLPLSLASSVWGLGVGRLVVAV